MNLRAHLRALHADQAGQTVVIVALSFTLLLGFVGLAIDGGRFYAERRFLQTAVDAAALGCVQKLVAGGTPTPAERALAILRTYNLPGDPTGTSVVVSDTPNYSTWFNALGADDKRNLFDGVYVGANDCRVAVQAPMRTFFIQLFGIGTLSIPANAHAVAKGGMLPVVVNRYLDPPGPSTTFIDYSKQEQFQLANQPHCFENDGPGDCPDAAEGSYSVDPVTGQITCGPCLWGPETVIVGQGYTSTSSDFRGFIVLDVRDFTSVDPSTGQVVHKYYNGAGDVSPNAWKDLEASYVNGGYPGPDLDAYIPNSNPVQKELQIGTLSGTSAGIVVSNFVKYFKIGDKILVQLFDGQVRQVPDFTIQPPSRIDATSPYSGDGPSSLKVGANQRFRDTTCTPGNGGTCWVDLEIARDTFNNGAGDDTPSQFNETSVTFTPDNFTPAGGSGTQVAIQNLQIGDNLAAGIYSVLIKGSGHWKPVPGGAITSTHQAWVPLRIGNVARDFAMNFESTISVIPSGGTATFTFTLTTGSSGSAWNGGDVEVALDKGDCLTGNVALFPVSGAPVCLTATVTGDPNRTPQKNSPPTVTVSIPTSGPLSGAHSVVLRARGTNSDNQKVVHVQPLTVAFGSDPGGGDTYINVQGYAVFVITGFGPNPNNRNTMTGRAITGSYVSPRDERLKVGQRPGLIPWEVAPCGLPSCPY